MYLRKVKSRFTYTRQWDLLLLWVRFFKPVFELMLCDFSSIAMTEESSVGSYNTKSGVSQ